MNDLPENLRSFIFEYIDSVEQLEVLLFLRLHSERSWASENVSSELRSNPASVASRLAGLVQIGLLQVDEQKLYRFQPSTPELLELSDLLAEAYRVKPHRVFELIFSPLKKVRHFAEAFVVTKPGTKKENGDG